MEERLKHRVNIPVWLITLIIPIIISISAFTINNINKQQELITRIEYVEKDLTSLKSDLLHKATTYEVKDLKSSLTRMEDKLDRLIEKNIK